MIAKLKPDQRDFDVDHVMRQLTLDEKISLLSGTDFWHTAAIKRLGIPAIRLSDGPNGVRGTKFFNGVPAACFPCGTALGATWNAELLETAGTLQAQEAIAKGASAILSPTVNIQRSPLGGRGFESYSEDPTLSGVLSAATINGIQSEGVAATLKHFVCNDQEDHRQSVSSIVTERALREIYLKPFQIAQRDAKPLAYMTAYNKVNGIHCSNHIELLQYILREEWAHDGLVMSDWYGTYATVDAIKAGLDLEMPGPSVYRGQYINKALSYGNLTIHDVDACVKRILKFVKHLLPLGLENAEETSNNTAQTSTTLRKIAGESIVLLKNDQGLLPLDPTKNTAVIGPNAGMAAYCGGGSAALDAYYTITPLEGISAQCSNTVYTLGAAGYKSLPLLSEVSRTKEGKKGLDMTVFLEPPSAKNRKAIDYIHVRKSEATLIDYKHPAISGTLFYADIDGFFVPDVSGRWNFSVSVAGTAKLYVDDECIVDNETTQTRGTSFFSTGSIEEMGSKTLEAGKTYRLHATFGSDPTTKLSREGVTPLGAAPHFNPSAEIAKARTLAQEADQVVLCIGLNGDWESEGFDRADMDLPAYVDELVRVVSAANPNTAVVVQSGTPVSMPWLGQTSAVMQAWYGGNECGNAIADVLFGAVNPSAKLPLTFPRRVQDNPAFLNSTSTRNRILYGEDVFVGYRHYEAVGKDVLFPFGHGLSYTAFKFDAATLRLQEDAADLVLSVDVRNTGARSGAQVVQVYVQQRGPSVVRPVKELRAFTKVLVEPGAVVSAQCRFSRKYATSWWDEERHAWLEEKDEYFVWVGDSSANTPLKTSFFVSETTWWNGL